MLYYCIFHKVTFMELCPQGMLHFRGGSQGAHFFGFPLVALKDLIVEC